MLFERTCRIAQDFDWFLRFVPQNSVEKRKNSKNHPENCTKKQAARFFRLPAWRCSSRQRLFPCFFYDASESERQRCTVPIEKRKINKNQSENCIKTGSTILSPACLGMFEPSKTFFMFLFVMPVNQNANAAQLRLKSEKSTRINQKTAQKQAARFFRLPVLGMFEPSKTFFMFLFVIPVNRVPTLHSFD